jgi:hypothetical protein
MDLGFSENIHEKWLGLINRIPEHKKLPVPFTN